MEILLGERRWRGVGSFICGMDGWLTCVTACTDESGSFCLGCLTMRGDRGYGMLVRCDGCTLHECLSWSNSTARKGRAATQCNELKS